MSRIVLTIKSLNISSIIRSSVGRSKMNSFGCFDLDVDNEWNSSVEYMEDLISFLRLEIDAR